MTNRRQFLYSGLAAATVGVVTGGMVLPGMAAGSMPSKRVEYHGVIFDQRFVASLGFARAVGASAGDAYGLSDGDITELWFNDLDPRWRKTPDVIAGLTTQSSLFCLEHLARDYGMEVSYRGEHIVEPGHRIRHDLTGPAYLLAQADAAQMRSDAWPHEIARLVRHYRAAQNAHTRSRQIAAGRPVPVEPGVDMLVSWIMAPARRSLPRT